MDYKMLLVLLILLFIIILLYREVLNLKDDMLQSMKNISFGFDKNNKTITSLIKTDIDKCVARIEDIGVKNIQQLQKITLLNHQPIRKIANHFTETENSEMRTDMNYLSDVKHNDNDIMGVNTGYDNEPVIIITSGTYPLGNYMCDKNIFQHTFPEYKSQYMSDDTNDKPQDIPIYQTQNSESSGGSSGSSKSQTSKSSNKSNNKICDIVVLTTLSGTTHGSLINENENINMNILVSDKRTPNMMNLGMCNPTLDKSLIEDEKSVSESKTPQINFTNIVKDNNEIEIDMFGYNVRSLSRSDDVVNNINTNHIYVQEPLIQTVQSVSEKDISEVDMSESIKLLKEKQALSVYSDDKTSKISKISKISKRSILSVRTGPVNNADTEDNESGNTNNSNNSLIKSIIETSKVKPMGAYTASDIKSISKHFGLPITYKTENGQRKAYKKDELYKNIRIHIKKK